MLVLLSHMKLWKEEEGRADKWHLSELAMQGYFGGALVPSQSQGGYKRRKQEERLKKEEL